MFMILSIILSLTAASTTVDTPTTQEIARATTGEIVTVTNAAKLHSAARLIIVTTVDGERAAL